MVGVRRPELDPCPEPLSRSSTRAVDSIEWLTDELYVVAEVVYSVLAAEAAAKAEADRLKAEAEAKAKAEEDARLEAIKKAEEEDTHYYDKNDVQKLDDSDIVSVDN